MSIYFVISFAALVGSALTFFSGFGLGTLLVPVFAVFFPVEMAIALTAIVHFLNNLFKILLVGLKARLGIVLRFGLPSLLASFAGAFVLTQLTHFSAIYTYNIGENNFEITPVKITIALLLLFFVLFDIVPRFAKLQFDQRHMVAGGLLSGFFGGLSGNQGALRSAFLIRAGLEKEVFVATGVLIACMVDIARLSIYADKILLQTSQMHLPLMVAATLAAFAGAFLGSRILKKITIKTLQLFVAILLIIFSLLLGVGII